MMAFTVGSKHTGTRHSRHEAKYNTWKLFKQYILQQIAAEIRPYTYSGSLPLPLLTKTLTNPCKVFCGFLQVPQANIIINV